MNSIGSALVAAKAIGIGVGCGAADFLYKTTVQKICMLAGVKFEELPDPDGAPEIPSSQRLDMYFKDMVITAPIAEELVFRGALQPLIAQGITMCAPQLATYAIAGIPAANLLSIVLCGTSFGAIHSFNYKTGGTAVGLTGTTTGILLGIVKEKLGLIASIAAHMTSNLSTGLLDKFYPTLLESDRETELRAEQSQKNN